LIVLFFRNPTLQLTKLEYNHSLNSKETKKLLKISDCELSHLRLSGKLNFHKKGNLFLYSLNSIEKYLEEKK
jgi:hypothetical protein